MTSSTERVPTRRHQLTGTPTSAGANTSPDILIAPAVAEGARRPGRGGCLLSTGHHEGWR
jgi:hypothetical protein